MYDDYDLWEDRMKLYLESVSEGNRSLAILGQLDSDVYAVARAANITSSLTTATIFERLRREFGRSPMPWVARATLRERRQHSGESVVDFQRHLRVLAKQAYPDDSCSALEDRILDNFVDGIANLDIRRKFMLDPPKTLKAALDSARDEEVIYAALSPSPGPSSSVPSGPRFQTAPPQSQMVNVFAMGPRPTCDIGTQTARWQWDPQPQSTPRYDHQRSTPRRGNWRDQRGRWNRPQYRPGVHTITAGEEEESGNPVLTFPDISDQAGIFVLDTDASETAIGAVLSQRQADGTERVIQYLSRSLTKAERRYCVTRKEMLALTFFIEECRPFLQYRKFLVRTDHSSLAWLRNFKNAEGQVARWQERLAGFEFDCNHRPGRQHNNADALSRKPYRPHGECPSCTDTSINNITLHEDQSSLWAQAQRDDPHIGPIYYRKLGESRPLSGPELRGLSYETRCLHTVWDKLFLDNEVLFYRDGDQYPRRIVLPLSMTDDVLTRIHTQLGHVGIHKTEWAVRRRYYWPNLRRYVWDFIRYCTLCNQLKPPPHLNRAPLQPILTGYPNELVGVDIIGPIAPSVRGNRYILVMVDFFTKMAEVEPLPNMSADTVAQAIFNGWDRERPFATEITVHFNRLKLGERPDAYGPEDQGNIVCDVDRDQVGRIVEIPPEGGDEFEVPFSDRRHNLEDNRSMLHDTSQNEGTAIAEDSDVSMEEGVMPIVRTVVELVGTVTVFPRGLHCICLLAPPSVCLTLPDNQQTELLKTGQQQGEDSRSIDNRQGNALSDNSDKANLLSDFFTAVYTEEPVFDESVYPTIVKSNNTISTVDFTIHMVSYRDVKTREAGPSSKERPNLIPFDEERRILGCICQEDNHHVSYLLLYKGIPTRCGCGHWFKLVDFNEYEAARERYWNSVKNEPENAKLLKDLEEAEQELQHLLEESKTMTKKSAGATEMMDKLLTQWTKYKTTYGQIRRKIDMACVSDIR
ncbi:hypothetical protein SprV_0501768100 [Sparganum proliferum]